MKADPLNFEIFSDQTVKIHIPREDISADCAWRNALDLERAAKLIENVQREESDLTLVIIFVIKETVAAQSAPGDAFDFRHFDNWKLVRLPAVVTDKIMAGRNVKMTNLHRSDDIIEVGPMKANGIEPGQIIRRKQDGELEYRHDELTVEEPLEIRICDKTIATTMRAPGHDEDLAAGFLFSEAIIRARDEIVKISSRENVVTIQLRAGVKPKLNSAQRFGTISSSCGLCGKESIEAIRQNFPPIKSRSFRIDIATLLSLPEKLRANQSDFARTGGIHAAGVFDSNGEAVTVREDIGRHNAVDKVIGRALLDGKLPLDGHVLLVSGRASFEIMQKALAAGIPVVASISAPSSLAMEFAREMNQTLVAFLRPPSFNIYSHVERIILNKD